MWCLDKPDNGPGRRGTNSNEVKNQAQWAPLAQAAPKNLFLNLQPRYYPGYLEGTDHDCALGCRLIANAKAVEPQFSSDSWTRLGCAILCRHNFTRRL
jgi:hypothetical protein